MPTTVSLVKLSALDAIRADTLTAAEAAVEPFASAAATSASAANASAASAASAASSAAMSVFGSTGFSAGDARWRKAVKFTFNRTTSPTGSVRTTTGYARGVRWDGVLTSVWGSGSPGSNISLDFGTAPAAPFNSNLPKFAAIYPCNVSGGVSGEFTRLAISNNQLTSFTGDFPALTELDLFNNQLTSFTGDFPALTELFLTNNQLTSFTGDFPALTELYLNNNQLTSFTGDFPALTGLYLNNNQLTSFTGDFPALIVVYLTNNQLTSFTGDFPALIVVNLNSNQLTEVRVQAALSYGSYGYHHIYGSRVDFNNLDAAALNEFFEHLLPAAGILMVGDNPGSATCDPTIATAKGYTVIGV